MKQFLLSFYILFLASTTLAMESSGTTNNCHCFKERSFNFEKKFAADSYLLTTNFNSFIAANFDITKSQIVMMKMKGGIDPDDLLIALYLSREGQVDLNALIAIRADGGSWKQIAESDDLHKKIFSDKVLQAILAADREKEAAAERITDQLLVEYFELDQTDIEKLRQSQMSGRILTLALNLERYGNGETKADEIIELYLEKQMSWGEIAHSFGLSPKATGRIFLPDAKDMMM